MSRLSLWPIEFISHTVTTVIIKHHAYCSQDPDIPTAVRDGQPRGETPLDNPHLQASPVPMANTIRVRKTVFALLLDGTNGPHN